MYLINISDLRNKYADKSWDVFNHYLENTEPLNGTEGIKKKEIWKKNA